VTVPFRCLRVATYESHEGERSLFVTNGDSLAAGAVDSGGVAARLSLGIKVALAVCGGQRNGSTGLVNPHRPRRE
jgi:hypothetical protein